MYLDMSLSNLVKCLSNINCWIHSYCSCLDTFIYTIPNAAVPVMSDLRLDRNYFQSVLKTCLVSCFINYFVNTVSYLSSSHYVKYY